jgi:hypothetical protein
MSSDMQIGKIAEYQFVVDASKRNLLPSIPVHDHRGYDLIVQGKTKLHKIQVKSTRTVSTRAPNSKGENSYRIVVSKGSKNKQSYQRTDLDFFAIYLFDLNQWFIIPFRAVTSKNIRLYPSKNDHKYSQYREAWHLIK